MQRFGHGNFWVGHELSGVIDSVVYVVGPSLEIASRG